MLDAIQSVAAATQSVAQSLSQAVGNTASTGTAASTATPFAELMTDAISSVNTLDSQAKSSVEGLMNGSGVDVHQAVIATEKASMAFELALSVRNKAVAAYQQVVGMQF